MQNIRVAVRIACSAAAAVLLAGMVLGQPLRMGPERRTAAAAITEITAAIITEPIMAEAPVSAAATCTAVPDRTAMYMEGPGRAVMCTAATVRAVMHTAARERPVMHTAVRGRAVMYTEAPALRSRTVPEARRSP